MRENPKVTVVVNYRATVGLPTFHACVAYKLSSGWTYPFDVEILMVDPPIENGMMTVASH